MTNIFTKRRPPVGARPGTLAFSEKGISLLEVTRYSPTAYNVDSAANVETLTAEVVGEPQVTWVDVQGVGNEHVLRELGKRYSIHPLALEDVVNAPQRPKVEEYPGQVLFIARTATVLSSGQLELQQVGLIIGDGYLLTFHDGQCDAFAPVRNRVREGKGAIRGSGASYLAYAIIDTVIDGYYPVIETYSAQIERLEQELSHDTTPAMLRELEQLKSKLVLLRRGLWPQLEAVGRLLREDSRLMPENVRLYLRDTHDHCAQLVDVLDSQREVVNGLVNTHLSLVAHRTNEVMKVLTIMSSVFIPLTFIVGVYGMNLRMPEAGWKWTYPLVLIAMAVSAGGMLLYFRRRGWWGGAR